MNGPVWRKCGKFQDGGSDYNRDPIYLISGGDIKVIAMRKVIGNIRKSTKLHKNVKVHI